MSRFRATVLAGALIASAATTVTAPDAQAQVWVESAFFSNQSGNVKCELVHASTGETFTLCVSDIARAIQPECNPPEHLIPAVRIEPNYVGTMCWNQGFPFEPTPLKPFQARSHGNATIIAGLRGDLYVFDKNKLALVRAGANNRVLFSLR